jgi:hypothetical protein
VSIVSDSPPRRAPLAAAHRYAYVSQLAMVNDDFARYWAEICGIPTSFSARIVRRAQSDGYCARDDPQLIAVANQGGQPDDEAGIDTLTNIFYRAIYCEEGR